MQGKLKDAIEKKKQLQDDIEECIVKIDRAKVLIVGLGGEKERWTQSLAQTEDQIKTILGDVLASSAIIAYLSNVNSANRNQMLGRWLA